MAASVLVLFSVTMLFIFLILANLNTWKTRRCLQMRMICRDLLTLPDLPVPENACCRGKVMAAGSGSSTMLASATCASTLAMRTASMAAASAGVG